MGLREFWNRLTGGDTGDRVEEEVRDRPDEQPERVEDFEAMKDDRRIDERFPGAEKFSSDEF
jgi:hypothetical protein